MFRNGELAGGIAYSLASAEDQFIIAALPDFLYGGPFGKHKQELADSFFSVKDIRGAMLIDASGSKLELPNEKDLTCEKIHFKDYDTWFQQIDGDARNQIRQATKRGLTLGTFTEKQFKKLDAATALRHRREVQEQWTHTLLSYASQPQHGTLLGAYKGKRLVSGVVLAKHKNKAYLLKNASLSEFFRFRPNHLLYAESVKWAIRNGCTSLNTGGAAEDGLRAFKRSLGSKEHKYYWYSVWR